MLVAVALLLLLLLLLRSPSCWSAIVVYGANGTELAQIAAYSANRWLGVTYENAVGEAREVRGRLVRFTGDYCDPSGIAADSVAGRVVLLSLSSATCPDFVIYDNFANRHAIAIIRDVPYGAGWRFTMPSIADDNNGGLGRNPSLVMVEARLSSDLGLAAGNGPDSATARRLLQDGADLLVRAEISPYIVVFSEVWYQILGRWLLVAVYAALAVLALHYGRGHLLLLRQGQQRRRTARQVCASLSQIHVALGVAVVKSTALAALFFAGGYGKVSELPYEASMAMSSHFMGLENSILIVTARFWSRLTASSDMTRHARPSRLADAVVAASATGAVLLDVVETTQLLSYRQSVAGVQLFQLNALVNGVLVLLIAVYFAVTIVIFRFGLRQLRRITGPSSDVRMGRFVVRFTRLGALLTLAMFTYLVLVINFSLHPYMDDQPRVFAAYASAYSLILPTISLFSILMLKPRRTTDRPSASGMPPASYLQRIIQVVPAAVIALRCTTNAVPLPVVAESVATH